MKHLRITLLTLFTILFISCSGSGLSSNGNTNEINNDNNIHHSNNNSTNKSGKESDKGNSFSTYYNGDEEILNIEDFEKDCYLSEMDAAAISDSAIVVDSRMTLQEAIAGTKAPKEIADSMSLLDVQYYGYDSKIHRGQLLVNKRLIPDLKKIFKSLYEKRFPIDKMIPIVNYEWNDNKSMTDNNTSAFNYRKVQGSANLSNHAYGRALDINPRDNPMIKNKIVYPSNGKYDGMQKGTILANGYVVKLFKSYGWKWGGDWTSPKDYQHFEKK